MARRRSSENDRPRLWLVRQPQGLVPATPLDLEEIERYRIGSRLICTLEQPRDEGLNRFFHALVGKVARAIGEEPESLKWWLKLECALRREVSIFDGSTSIIPRSLTELDQAEFSAFVDRACEVITTRIIPGADIEELMVDASKHAGET